jgi:hypothetical protein
MDIAADTTGMELAMVIFMLVVGPLAVLFGADSQVTDTRDKRRWL